MYMYMYGRMMPEVFRIVSKTRNYSQLFCSKKGYVGDFTQQNSKVMT